MCNKIQEHTKDQKTQTNRTTNTHTHTDRITNHKSAKTEMLSDYV